MFFVKCTLEVVVNFSPKFLWTQACTINLSSENKIRSSFVPIIQKSFMLIQAAVLQL